MLTQEDLDNIRRIYREENARKDAPAVQSVSHTSAIPPSDMDVLRIAAQNVANAHAEDAYIIKKPCEKTEGTEHIPYIVLTSQANAWEKNNFEAVVHPEKKL